VSKTDAKPWLNPGSWHSAPAFWDDETAAIRQMMPKKIKFIDCTLTEGDDCVGHQLNWNTRLGLMERLDAIGIGSITLPSHARVDEEEDLVRAYRRLGLKTPLVAKGPGYPRNGNDVWKKTADRLLKMEAEVMSPIVSVGYSETFSGYTAGLTREEVAGRFQEVISYLKQRGATVVPWIEETFRGSVENAVFFAKAIVEAGADGVYLVDSRGNSHPLATRILVRRVREAIGANKDLYVQHHNDLGIATANALADVEGGANWIDCTVTGIGDRGGTVCLLEAACLFALYGIDTGIDLKQLNDIGTYVRDAYGLSLAPWKTVIGERWNMEEGRGHLAGSKNAEASFGIAPEVVGRKMEMVIGGKILFGKERSSLPTDDPVFVKDLLSEWGVKPDATELERILLRSRAAVATSYGKHYLTEEEFRRIVEGVVGGPVGNAGAAKH
jgi:isopropylmalate/homocitrate/citramalate synthase